MKFGQISRIATLPEHGTFGAFVLDGNPFCVTLEPYQGKIIPAWVYIAEPYDSPTFGPVYLLKDVHGRSYIEIHQLNRDVDTRGCIGLASHYGNLYGDLAILNSGNTHRKFLEAMNGDTLHLTIKDCF